METYAYDIQDRVENWHWWFAGRRKILFAFLRSQLDLKQKPKILDVGCGTGINLQHLQSLGQAVGLDHAPPALKYAREKNSPLLVRASCEALPFKKECFDLITSLDNLEHIDDDTSVLKELYGALKPGGRLLVSVPAFEWLWGLQDDVSHHKRRYTKSQLLAKLESADFTVMRATYFNTFLFLPIALGRLLLKILPHKFESENEITARGVNEILKAIFSTEAWFLKRMNFPIGVSILAIAKKV